MTHELAILAMGILTAVVLLMLGSVAGYWAGARSVLPVLATDPLGTAWQEERGELLGQLTQCIEAGELAAEQCAALAALSRSEVNALPAEILKAIGNVVQTTGGLAIQLHDLQSLTRLSSRMQAPVNREPEKSAAVTAKRVPEPTHAASLTTEQMSDAMGGRRHIGDSTFGLESKRYPYDRQQHLAILNDAADAPSLEQFERVRCHEISVSGISFFLPEEPEFKTVVISIGAGDKLILMQAEVSHHRAVCMHGEVSFLVTCRYVCRLDELTARWHAEEAFAVVGRERGQA